MGFIRIGFISADGSSPAAAACTTCARPISSPSAVTKELSAMFWDLKGATRKPSCRSTRRIPAVSMVLPAPDMVPWIIRFRAISSSVLSDHLSL